MAQPPDKPLSCTDDILGIALLAAPTSGAYVDTGSEMVTNNNYYRWLH